MDKYKYTYEITANYCYKDSDVLINKLNITNDEDLFNAPSAYDFTVKVADYKNFGDPYWNK